MIKYAFILVLIFIPVIFLKTKLNSDVHMDEISRFIYFLRRVRRGRVGVVEGENEGCARERERDGSEGLQCWRLFESQ